METGKTEDGDLLSIRFQKEDIQRVLSTQVF